MKCNLLFPGVLPRLEINSPWLQFELKHDKTRTFLQNRFHSTLERRFRALQNLCAHVFDGRVFLRVISFHFKHDLDPTNSKCTCLEYCLTLCKNSIITFCCSVKTDVLGARFS